MLERRAMIAVAVVVAALAGPAAAQPPAPQAQEVTFPSGNLVLHGFLYKPDGSGPFPALIWNHGSGPKPGSEPALGALYASRGYVFFVPFRRGHGRSPGDYMEDDYKSRPPEERGRALVAMHEAQFEDTKAAVAYVKTLPYVDPGKIVMSGCSYGGIQALLAAEAGLGLRAVVPFAPAAMTWSRHSEVRDRMVRAVHGSALPILILQAANDFNTDPSQVLGQVNTLTGRPPRIHVYPPFGKTPEEGHLGFCTQAGDIWGPEVFDFLRESLAAK